MHQSQSKHGAKSRVDSRALRSGGTSFPGSRKEQEYHVTTQAWLLSVTSAWTDILAPALAAISKAFAPHLQFFTLERASGE